MTTNKPNTGIDQNKEMKMKESDGMIQEKEDRQEQIKEVLDTSIIDSIEFLLMSENHGESVKNAIKNLNLQSLKDVSIIDFSYKKSDNNSFTDFLGLDVALEKKLKDNEKKIILTSLINTDIFLSSPRIPENSKNKLKLLLSLPNVKFLEVPYSPEDLISVFDNKKSEDLNENYLSTISFNFGEDKLDKEYEFAIKEELKKINLENLKDAKCFSLEGKYDFSSQLQEFKSADFILNELASEPDKKVIIFTTFHLENLETILNRKSDQYKLLLNNPNVKFFTIGEDIKKLENIFDKEGAIDNKEINTEVAFQNIMESEISRFLHDSKYWIALGDGSHLTNEEQLTYLFDLPEEKKNDKWIEFENRLTAMLQMQHSSFKQLPRDKNLQRIVDMYKYSRTKGLPEGTRFEGVFVDRDGTLYDNKNLKFNQNVIDMIKDYEKQGKKIIIRTGGNLEMKQMLLDEAGLDYKIENKTDYKGGTVEIAIDNDPQEFLLANAKIKSETHIKV